MIWVLLALGLVALGGSRGGVEVETAELGPLIPELPPPMQDDGGMGAGVGFAPGFEGEREPPAVDGIGWEGSPVPGDPGGPAPRPNTSGKGGPGAGGTHEQSGGGGPRPNKIPAMGQPCQRGNEQSPGNQVRLLGKGNVRATVCAGTRGDAVVVRPEPGMLVEPRIISTGQGDKVAPWPNGTIVKPTGQPTLVVWDGRLARYPTAAQIAAVAVAVTSAQALALSVDPFVFAGVIRYFFGKDAQIDAAAFKRLAGFVVHARKFAKNLKYNNGPNRGLSF